MIGIELRKSVIRSLRKK